MQSFKPQKVLHLAKELEKKNPNINHQYMISEKIDGWYTYIFYSPDKGFSKIFSNAGRQIPAFEDASKWFPAYLPRSSFPYVLIMEAYIPDMDFHEMNGRFNRSLNCYQETDVVFKVHDLIRLGYSGTIIDKRYAAERYKDVVDLCKFSKSLKIKEVPVVAISKDMDTWKTLFDTITYAGGEGIVLKQATGIFMPEKRNSSLMKLKLEETYDLLCTNMYKTIGEKGNENTNVTLTDKTGTIVSVRVGKFSDIDSFAQESPIGKVISIKCMSKLEDGSYREPRFKCLRPDKTTLEID